jgi:hypothetical protein
MYTYYKMIFPPLIVIFIVIPMFIIMVTSYAIITYLSRYHLIEPEITYF